MTANEKWTLDVIDGVLIGLAIVLTAIGHQYHFGSASTDDVLWLIAEPTTELDQFINSLHISTTPFTAPWLYIDPAVFGTWWLVLFCIRGFIESLRSSGTPPPSSSDF